LTRHKNPKTKLKMNYKHLICYVIDDKSEVINIVNKIIEKYGYRAYVNDTKIFLDSPETIEKNINSLKIVCTNDFNCYRFSMYNGKYYLKYFFNEKKSIPIKCDNCKEIFGI
jgi:hypothetical protein